tara:strand:- start:5926 stop:6924 length:999 start_codon:yes stop_codon:yes gene_type:complete
MALLDQTPDKCLIVTDDSRKFLGTLTDGDIRRAILAGKLVSDNISEVYFKESRTLDQSSFNEASALLLIKENDLPVLPVIDTSGSVVDYVSLKKLGIRQRDSDLLTDTPVVIMAGGKGTRLQPITNFLPKPLIPVGNETTLIEKIISQFTKFGCKKFIISVNYKSKLIKSYFEELNPAYEVKFIEEDKPLGTIGSLALAKKYIDRSFFVTNCDIQIKANLNDFKKHHLDGNFHATIMVSTKRHVIPYGTCELKTDGSLAKIIEKPSHELLINTGLYFFERRILDFITPNTKLDATDLIQLMISNSKRIGVFPINSDSWSDFGQWDDLKNKLF